MSRVKNAAVDLDAAIEALSEAYDRFVEACLVEDKAFRAERKAASSKWPTNSRSQRGVQSHPVVGMPSKLLKAALCGKPKLARALGMNRTQVASIAALLPDEDGETVE